MITAGISVGESIDTIKANGAEPGAVLIGLDRQEKTLDSVDSAAKRIRENYNVPVYAVANMDLLIEYLRNDGEYNSLLEAMKIYRNQYGSVT